MAQHTQEKRVRQKLTQEQIQEAQKERAAKYSRKVSPYSAVLFALLGLSFVLNPAATAAQGIDSMLNTQGKPDNSDPFPGSGLNLRPDANIASNPYLDRLTSPQPTGFNPEHLQEYEKLLRSMGVPSGIQVAMAPDHMLLGGNDAHAETPPGSSETPPIYTTPSVRLSEMPSIEAQLTPYLEDGVMPNSIMISIARNATTGTFEIIDSDASAISIPQDLQATLNSLTSGIDSSVQRLDVSMLISNTQEAATPTPDTVLIDVSLVVYATASPSDELLNSLSSSEQDALQNAPTPTARFLDAQGNLVTVVGDPFYMRSNDGAISVISTQLVAFTSNDPRYQGWVELFELGSTSEIIIAQTANINGTEVPIKVTVGNETKFGAPGIVSTPSAMNIRSFPAVRDNTLEGRTTSGQEFTAVAPFSPEANVEIARLVEAGVDRKDITFDPIAGTVDITHGGYQWVMVQTDNGISYIAIGNGFGTKNSRNIAELAALAPTAFGTPPARETEVPQTPGLTPVPVPEAPSTDSTTGDGTDTEAGTESSDTSAATETPEASVRIQQILESEPTVSENGVEVWTDIHLTIDFVTITNLVRLADGTIGSYNQYDELLQIPISERQLQYEVDVTTYSLENLDISRTGYEIALPADFWETWGPEGMNRVIRFNPEFNAYESNDLIPHYFIPGIGRYNPENETFQDNIDGWGRAADFSSSTNTYQRGVRGNKITYIIPENYEEFGNLTPIPFMTDFQKNEAFSQMLLGLNNEPFQQFASEILPTLKTVFMYGERPFSEFEPFFTGLESANNGTHFIIVPTVGNNTALIPSEAAFTKTKTPTPQRGSGTLVVESRHLGLGHRIYPSNVSVLRMSLGDDNTLSPYLRENLLLSGPFMLAYLTDNPSLRFENPLTPEQMRSFPYLYDAGMIYRLYVILNTDNQYRGKLFVQSQ